MTLHPRSLSRAESALQRRGQCQTRITTFSFRLRKIGSYTMTATVETVVSTAIVKGRLILLLKIRPTAWRKGVCQNYRGAVKESLSKDETRPRNARSMQSSTMPISEPRLNQSKDLLQVWRCQGQVQHILQPGVNSWLRFRKGPTQVQGRSGH